MSDTRWNDEEPLDEGDPSSDDFGSFREGQVVAGRYVLQRVLGNGSFGEVWSAFDRDADRTVAIKLLFSHVEIDLARWEEEVYALRQGIPGVVGLFDVGEDERQRFVVMELVDGAAFPGRPVPCSWDDLRDTALSLLETLGWVHAAFVVHRDLKPANVLVTRDSQVRLLDFGVAFRQGPLSNDTRETLYLLGTPLYMAPEQIQRRPTTERSDLYSVGLMLYQALSGKIPHADGTPTVFFARLHKAVPPLREVAPAVPENVARVIGQLLEKDPSARPSSAFEVVASLRGEGAAPDPLFLWLGPRTGYLRVLESVRAGRSIDLVGPRGSGRTRWIASLREPLSTTHTVLLVEPLPGGGPASEPLRDLRPIAETLGLPVGGDVDALAASLTERLREALAGGHALLVDDHEDLDERSRAVIDAVAPAGGVVRALRQPLSARREADVVRIPSLTEADLEPLFAGPDRLFHLREDAARVLHQRTDGSPARVFRELGAWLRLGLVRRVRNLLVIQRSTIEQLEFGVLAEVMLAPAGAPPVVEVTRQAISAEDSTVRVQPLSQAKTVTPGQRGRLSHFFRATQENDASARELGREALAIATSLFAEARIGAAIAAIEIGLHALRWMRSAPCPEGEGLFLLWTEAVLDEGRPGAAERLSHSIHKSSAWPGRDVIEAVARALKVDIFASHRAFEAAQAIAPQTDPRLERLRVRTLLRAMRLRLDDAAEEALLADVRAASGDDPQIALWIRSAFGRLRYRQGRFLEAAEHHEAASRSERLFDRISEKNAAAWALFEAFELDRAQALATEAHALAERHRHAGQEASAAWTLRSIAYRRGVAGPPDMDLARAVMYAVDRQVQAVILCTEAAAAYREDHPDGLSLASRAHDIFSSLSQPRGALLARGLSIALGAAPREGEIKMLQQKACSIQGGGIGLQALALLARRGHLPPPDSAPRIKELAAEIPRTSWGVRMDILSVEECLSALGVAG
ncbi:MAG: serine/threonine-protein kinase [Polyangiaceae bacterium]